MPAIAKWPLPINRFPLALAREYGLPFIPSDERQPCGWVYALMQGQHTLYVGATTNLVARVQGHKRVKTFDSTLFWEVPVEERYIWEVLLMQATRPTANAHYFPSPSLREEDMERVLTARGYHWPNGRIRRLDERQS